MKEWIEEHVLELIELVLAIAGIGGIVRFWSAFITMAHRYPLQIFSVAMVSFIAGMAARALLEGGRVRKLRHDAWYLPYGLQACLYGLYIADGPLASDEDEGSLITLECFGYAVEPDGARVLDENGNRGFSITPEAVQAIRGDRRLLKQLKEAWGHGGTRNEEE